MIREAPVLVYLGITPKSITPWLISVSWLPLAIGWLLAGLLVANIAAETFVSNQAEKGGPQASSESQEGLTKPKIVPESVAIAVGDPQIFRLKDSNGAIITDAKWSISDPKIVNAQLGREARLTGLQAGRLTLTATWKGFKVEAQVRIYEFNGLGPSPPLGSTTSATGPTPEAASSPLPPLEFKMRVTPDIMSVIVGEPRQVRLNDPDGKMIRDATWTVTDPGVIRLEPGAEPILVGLAPGIAFITAVWHAEKAEAKIIVFPGRELPQGTVRWSVAALPGFVTKTTGQSLTLSAEGADLVTVEYDRFGRWMTRGLASDGRELWATQIDFKQKNSSACGPAAAKPCDAKTAPAAPRTPR